MTSENDQDHRIEDQKKLELRKEVLFDSSSENSVQKKTFKINSQQESLVLHSNAHKFAAVV